MDTLVETASTSFSTIIGFPISEVVDAGVAYLKLTAGTALAFFQAVYPVLLVVAGIYIFYKIARWGWAQYS